MKLSIIIPCLNESLYIKQCLDSLLANDFSQKEMEILVIDGGSTDGTLEIIKEYIIQYDFIKLIKNEKKLKPIALNMGINEAQGDVIMRIDAHAVYDKNYISKLVDLLFSDKADNTGGIRHTYIPPNGSCMEIVLSEAISHPLVVGDAFYRTGTLKEKKIVDTVFCGCYRKEVFDKIGGFNEKLIRTQDRELNSRLIESGGKILLDPDVHCTYFPRVDFLNYLKWNWKGAVWLGYANKFTDTKMLSVRNYVPSFFVLYLIVALILRTSYFDSSAVSLLSFLAITPLFIYFVLLFNSGLKIAIKYRKIFILFSFPLVTFLTHISYGIGIVFGRIKSII